jgi:hypothetical protein
MPSGPKNVKSAEHSLSVRSAVLAKCVVRSLCVSLKFRENKTLMGASEPHSRVHTHRVAAGWLLLLLLFSFYFSYLLLLAMHRIRACPEWLMSFAATCHPVHGVNQVLIFQYTHTRALSRMNATATCVSVVNGWMRASHRNRTDRLEFLTSNLINLVKFWLQNTRIVNWKPLLLVMSQYWKELGLNFDALMQN